MHNENLLAVYAQLPAPVLSVYVNRSQEDAARHRPTRAELAWLSTAAETLRDQLSHSDRRSFDRQVKRVCRFLEQRRAAERSVVIFAGTKCWEMLPLQVAVRNELHWGKASLAPLLPVLYGHRRYGVVVMDHTVARYFALTHDEIATLGDKHFGIDSSQWKHKDQAKVCTERAQKPRGPLRELYERRVQARYQQFCHEVAEEVSTLATTHEFHGLFLVGPSRLIRVVREKLPRPLAAMTSAIQENLARSTAKELLRFLQPIADRYEEQQQVSSVALIGTAGRAALTNPDEVLAQLQNGRIRLLLVASGLEFSLRQCPKCGWASRSADHLCPDCSSVRQEVTLGDLLARLVSTQNFNIEFLSGHAAELLRRTGGLGGWLRATRVAAAS